MHHTLRPHLYLDTNIVLDKLLGRQREEAQHSRVLIQRIVTHGWKVSTARFAFVEALDELKRQRQRRSPNRLTFLQLNRIYDNLTADIEEKYPFLEFEYPVRKEFWDTLEIICGVTNLRRSDSIHMATANGGLFDVLVTNDKNFVRIAAEEVPVRFQVPTALPQHLDDALRQAGFVIQQEDGQATRKNEPNPASR